MINTPTVLIFGAGASCPYGFPSAIGLRSKILENLRERDGVRARQLYDVGHSSEEIASFRDDFFFSGKDSVDAFLEHRPEFVEVGKAAIAQALIGYESLGVLFQNLNDNFYSYIYKHLDTSVQNFPNNKLSILTFNYDRSFEQFMFTALKRSYGLPDDVVAGLVGTIPIVHLHGHVGLLPWQGAGAQEYGGNITPERILNGRKNIKIVHEALEDDPEFQRAYELITAAKKLVFLGFGYGAANLRRLKIDFSDDLKEISGSCLGFSDLERSQLRMDCANKLHLGNTTENALMFLRNNVLLAR